MNIHDFKFYINECQTEDMDSYTNFDKCKSCKGRCCRNRGCLISPTDIKPGFLNFGELMGLLETGLVSIDWYTEENKRLFYLRMRHKNANVVNPAFRGECVLYDENHPCPLEYKHRPKGGRLLVPVGDECTTDYNNYKCAEEWKPYGHILQELCNYYLEHTGSIKNLDALEVHSFFDDVCMIKNIIESAMESIEKQNS